MAMEDTDHIESAIKSLRIQGATNVAFAVLDAMAKDPNNAAAVGERLAYARPTEPLAQNGLRYVLSGKKDRVSEKIQQFKEFITRGKRNIVEHGKELLVDGGSYLTICHSSTVVELFRTAREKGAIFHLYVAETRPLFQGRITASELINNGFDDITMVIDDVAVSLIEERKGKIDAVFIGADLLSHDGFVNKVGSLVVVASAEKMSIPVFVVTTMLKYDPRPFDRSVIEMRGSEEIWPDAPKNLQFYAPAFDYVRYSQNIRVVCEAGIMPGHEVTNAVQKLYPFIVS